MRLSRRFIFKSSLRLVNAALVTVLILSLALPGAAQAAPSAQVDTNGTCETTAKTYLPVVQTPGDGLLAGVRSILTNPQVVERELKYEVGKTYVYGYAVTVLTKASQRDSEGTAESDKSKTIMAAQAEISITGQENDGTFVGQVVMKRPFVCTADLENEQDNVADTSELSTELAKPLVFRQKPNGVISSVSYPADARAQVVNLQKGVINALQTLLQDGSDTYSAPEVGGQGTYTATYTLQEQNDLLTITKSYDQGDFSELNKSGDDIDSLELDSQLTQVLDGSKGVLTEVESTETLTTGDGAAEPENQDTDEVGTFDGSATWTTVESTGELTLSEIKNTPELRSAALDATYVDGGLEPLFDTEAGNPRGIDLDQVDLDAEFEGFEADANNPLTFERILDLYAADTGETVFNKIVERLQATASNPDIANRYVDILTVIGTPEAQKVLTDMLSPAAHEVSIAATLQITTQEQALINLVLIDSPTMTTVNTLQDIGGLDGSADPNFKDTAISVLGAAIHNLSDEQPDTAQSLADELVAGLSTAVDQNEVEAFLDALGNAGIPGTLDEISQYTNIEDNVHVANTGVISETDIIEASAYYALRRIPGRGAEDILVAGLQDETHTNGTRLLISDVLVTIIIIVKG